MPSAVHAELLILGCGPAGYSAAVYAARANLRLMLVSGSAKVKASTTSAQCIPARDDVGVDQENELKQRLRDHARRFSTRVVFDCIQTASLARRPFRLTGVCETYTCDALILAISLPIARQLFQGQLEMSNGQLITQTGLSGMTTMTSIEGVFAAGNAPDSDFGAVITSTGTGCMAALDAQRFLGH